MSEVSASSGRLSTNERGISIALAALMATQALLGLLASGAYRDVAWIKATWFGNDLVTLLIAVPLLLGAMWSASRGSTRARLIWLGVLGYAVYNYTYYVLGAALNVFTDGRVDLDSYVRFLGGESLVRQLSVLSAV